MGKDFLKIAAQLPHFRFYHILPIRSILSESCFLTGWTGCTEFLYSHGFARMPCSTSFQLVAPAGWHWWFSLAKTQSRRGKHIGCEGFTSRFNIGIWDKAESRALSFSKSTPAWGHCERSDAISWTESSLFNRSSCFPTRRRLALTGQVKFNLNSRNDDLLEKWDQLTLANPFFQPQSARRTRRKGKPQKPLRSLCLCGNQAFLSFGISWFKQALPNHSFWGWGKRHHASTTWRTLVMITGQVKFNLNSRNDDLVEKRDQLTLKNPFFNHKVHERHKEKRRFKNLRALCAFVVVNHICLVESRNLSSLFLIAA